MEALDPAEEWRYISERYRQMSDEELLALAPQSSELTHVAQQALAVEMSRRGLKLQPEEPALPPEPEPDPDSPYADSPYAKDRELVEIRTVWSLSDALQLQSLLDGAGIPFFMGPEKATSAGAVTSNFANGVSVKIMSVGVPWARQAMMHYTPENEPAPTPQEELSEPVVRCPKCHSEEVVFDGLIGDGQINDGQISDDLDGEPRAASGNSQPKFGWTCDSCGHRWKDDGIVDE
jgi:DNA-directed RNA polymerase subunit M/transcription elongation factor TFIIS